MRLALAALVIVSSFQSLSAATFLRLSGEPGEYVSGGNTYDFGPADGAFSFRTEFDGAVTVQFHQPVAPFHWFDLTFKPYPGMRLDPGVYPNAARWPFQFQQPGMSIAGDGRGCNMLTGSFEVISATYDTAGVVTSLHVRFEQFCEHPTAPRLSGEVSLGPEAPVPTMSELMIVMLVITLAAVGVFGIGTRLRM